MPVVSQTVLVPPTHPVRWLASVVCLVAAACAAEGDRAASVTVTTTAAEGPSTTATVLATSTTVLPASRPTTSGPPATVVSRGDPSRRMVALTFDAGADAGFAAQILDVLDASGVHATFGITGRWAQAQPDLVTRMAAAGHLVMNHSYDHRSFTGVSAKPALLSTVERQADVERTEEVIRNLTGRTTRPWFRPPYGDYDASVNAAVGALGYRYNVLWTVDSLGWQGLSRAAIADRCLRGAVPGAILLFHVGAQSQDAAALPAILAGLRRAGYAFGTVAEVLPA